MDGESKPLLEGSDGQKPNIPDYQSKKGADGISSEESKKELSVSCRVCRNSIDVIKRADQHVVKCAACGEATPIRNPPPGKKYVRCPCHCLLICNSSSPRIACPRQNCRRIISLSPSTPEVPLIPGMARVTCVHCQDSFLFNTLKNVLARCPRCQKMSSVGPNFAKTQGHWYMAAFLVFLVIGVTLTATTYRLAQVHSSYIGLYASCFVLSLLFLGRSIYFYTMKISSIGGTV